MYHRDRMCRWVPSVEVYNQLDCLSVTPEHTMCYRVLCRSPPSDFHAAGVDPGDIKITTLYEETTSTYICNILIINNTEKGAKTLLNK